MKVTLTGPTELGNWFLMDDQGGEYPLVEKWNDLPAAAELFGWKPPEGMEDSDELGENAQEFLVDHINDEITAPNDVAKYFQELYGEE